MNRRWSRRLARLTGLITRPLDRLAGPPPAGPSNERPVEYNFALRCLAGACPASVLDVGPGLSPWPALLAHCGYQVTAIDEMKSFWRRSIFNRHFYVHRDDIRRPALTGQFDAVTCISTLEHIDDCDAAVRAILSLTRPGGHVILTFPYNEDRRVDDVYRLPGAGYGRDAPYICRVFSRAQVDGWLAGGRGSIVAQEYYRVFAGDLWTFGERVFPLRPVGRAERHHLTAILIRKES